jgi:hypothetical protein
MKGKAGKGIVKLCTFFLLANLPFLTMTHLLGIDTFLDSFEHPESYQYMKSDNVQFTERTGGYLVLQNPASEQFSIEKGDTLLYRTKDGAVECRSVYQVTLQRGIKTYYTTTVAEDELDGPIYDHQIIGKVTGIIDDNIWNALSLQIWDLSIENLNAVALFTNT